MNVERIGIIGAGMAGLACARRLTARGHRPVLLDKGRGVGGRLATRRAENGLQFDHGAQYIAAKSAAFKAVINELIAQGATVNWEFDGQFAYTGTPSMNALAKALAGDLDIRRGVEINSIEENADSWVAHARDAAYEFDRLVVTVPAPQTGRLLGSDHPLVEAIQMVRMQPCWTLMVAFSEAPKKGPNVLRQCCDPFAWISRESAKPDRIQTNSMPNAFVAQASPEWSQAHLELDKEKVSALLLDLLSQLLEIDPTAAVHKAAHRWRYAKVGVPLGMPFISNMGSTLFLGGDWCLGARVEYAWQSGNAIAEALLRDAL